MKMCPKSKSFTRSSSLLPHQIRVRCPLTSTFPLILKVTSAFEHMVFYLCCFTFCIYPLLGGISLEFRQALKSLRHIFPFLSETQDELEAITNEIKKMANNARNKLKSESDTRAQPRIKWHPGIFNTESEEYCKMI